MAATTPAKQVPIHTPGNHATSGFGNVYQFAGRRFDESTGFYYYRNRYYEPRSGRFIQRDPSGYEDGPNVYEYVRLNPTNRTDHFGEQSKVLDPNTGEDTRKGREGRYPDLINCAGYAMGLTFHVEPSEKLKESIEQMLSKYGWKCDKNNNKIASKDCKCQCNQRILMLYIKYKFNPQNKNPFSDPWIFKKFRNDYHLIRCEDKPVAGGTNKRTCSTGWTYVPASIPKLLRERKPIYVKDNGEESFTEGRFSHWRNITRDNPKAASKSETDADDWKNRNGNYNEGSYCCCSKEIGD